MVNIDNMENKLVVQANTLIEASYKLKPSQQKFLRVMASMIDFGDEDFKMYEFRVSDLMDLYGIKDQSKYSEIPKQTKELMGNILNFKDEKTEILVPFLSFYKHEKGEGIIRVQFHPFLKPFYLYLNKENPFTKYQLKNIVSLKSTYSIRFYELLKQYEGVKSRTLTINEIREIFRIEPSEYIRYNDFKRKVILQAQKELPLKTDISFEFEEIKTGRKVTAIKFYIHSNKKLNKTRVEKEVCATIEEDPKEKDLIKMVQNILDEQITDLEAKKLLATASGNIDTIKEKYEIAKSTPKIQNLVGWLTTAIKYDYKFPTEKVVRGSFNAFEQRPYDGSDGGMKMSDLELQLLGWDLDKASEDEEPINFNQSTNDKIDDKLDIKSITEKLKSIAELKELGIITQEEFENKKAILLNKI